MQVYDTISIITSYLHVADIVELLHVNKEYNILCSTDAVWKVLVARVYPYLLTETDNPKSFISSELTINSAHHKLQFGGWSKYMKTFPLCIRGRRHMDYAAPVIMTDDYIYMLGYASHYMSWDDTHKFYSATVSRSPAYTHTVLSRNLHFTDDVHLVSAYDIVSTLSSGNVKIADKYKAILCDYYTKCARNCTPAYDAYKLICKVHESELENCIEEYYSDLRSETSEQMVFTGTMKQHLMDFSTSIPDMFLWLCQQDKNITESCDSVIIRSESACDHLAEFFEK